MTDQLWAFLGVAILVIVTPGPDTALTIRNSLLGGSAAGVATAIGVALGQGVWALGTSLGILGLLLASAGVFHVVQLLGAAYLIFLGAQSLWAMRSAGPGVQAAGSRLHLSRRLAFRQGIVSNLGNPKMAVFFASLLPQFAPSPDFAHLLRLGLIFSMMTLVWLALYAIAISRARSWLLQGWIGCALKAATGVVLIALGLRLATERP